MECGHIRLLRVHNRLTSFFIARLEPLKPSAEEIGVKVVIKIVDVIICEWSHTRRFLRPLKAQPQMA